MNKLLQAIRGTRLATTLLLSLAIVFGSTLAAFSSAHFHPPEGVLVSRSAHAAIYLGDPIEGDDIDTPPPTDNDGTDGRQRRHRHAHAHRQRRYR